jgi:bacillithiol biosynthesis cysteine-adding enzyme BshC
VQQPQDSTHVTSVRQAIDIRQYPGFRRLAVDYAYAFDRVADAFAGNPASLAAWRETVGRVQAHAATRDRHAVADALLAQQQKRGAPPESRASAELLRDASTVAVVTGQQAGLFGGPLFTLLKAVTAIKVARRVHQELGVPAVPIFWIDAEDHDWNEVAGATVLDADYAATSVRLADPDGAGTLPVARLTMDASIADVIDRLAAILPPTEFTGTLLTRLRATYRPGAGLSDAFGRWLEFVLGEFGLVVYCSADPATKPLVRHVFAREAQFPGMTAELAASAGQALVERGYHSQVEPHADALAMFSLDDGRTSIRHTAGQYEVGGRTMTLPALLADIDSRPEAYSPNVLLRPIVQDTLFPTVSYVAGPNELAYLGQLRPVYGHFGVPMPLMYPRGSATLLDSAGARFLERYTVPLASLQAQDESALNHLLETLLPPEVEQSLTAAAAAIDAQLGRVIAAVPTIDPTLEGAARSVQGKVVHELQGLHHKVISAAKRRDDTLRRQFTKTRALAFPNGHAQERTVGFVYFLNRYGPGLVDTLLADLPVELGSHWLLTV